jgi:hypothetical protein
LPGRHAYARAQSPLDNGFTYQGQLNENGQPFTGDVNFTFFLYDAQSGGVQIGNPVSKPNERVENGLFTLIINRPDRFGPNAFNGEQRWLEIWANGKPLSPRQELTAAPYALFALRAPWSGLIGVPDVALLSSAQTFTARQTFSAGMATNAFQLSASPQPGYVLTSDGAGNGSWQSPQVPVPLTVSGSQSNGPIITGENTNTSGSAIGISARTLNGAAVNAEATGTAGINVGVSAVTESPNGFAVYGVAHSTGTGSAYGGYFESRNTSGAVAVYGQTTFGATGDVGGWFRSQGTSGRGVIGMALGSGATRAVWGQVNSPDGYGVYSSGNLHIDGNFTATGNKSFRIDHPDDPANKYLLHYAAESPEVINFYSETVTLDERGEAVVELPHYFAKINRRPRYQLTAVGAPMPMLHVAEEIDEAAPSAGAEAGPGEPAPVCWFRIAGGAPGAKVSWRVEALRNDRWVQTHAAPVEIEKEGLEKGTYQHPELYGHPPEMGMDFRPESVRPSQLTLPDATLRE